MTTVPDTVRFWLHVEGGAVLVAASVLYNHLGGNWLFAIPLLLLPDLSAVGYLGGPRLGSFTYNLVHNWAIGLAVLGLVLLARQQCGATCGDGAGGSCGHGPTRRLRPEAHQRVQGHPPTARVSAHAPGGHGPVALPVSPARSAARTRP